MVAMAAGLAGAASPEYLKEILTECDKENKEFLGNFGSSSSSRSSSSICSSNMGQGFVLADKLFQQKSQKKKTTSCRGTT